MSHESDGAEEVPPLAPRLPEPPQAGYQRPRRKADPAEAFLARRGLGGADAGNMGKAMAMGTSLVGSILAGALLGWLADTYLIKATTPWGLIVGFLLGTISGFTNLVKLANEINKS